MRIWQPLFNRDAASCIEYLQTEVSPLPFPVPLETAMPSASTIPPPTVAQSASARPPPPSAIQPSSAMLPPHHSDLALLVAATCSGKVYMVFLGEVLLDEASWREASLAGCSSNSSSKPQQSSGQRSPLTSVFTRSRRLLHISSASVNWPQMDDTTGRPASWRYVAPGAPLLIIRYYYSSRI